MSDEKPYTPTTTMVRLSYIASTKDDGDPDWTREEAKAEFMRWLAAEKAKAVADAEAQQAQIAAQEPAGEPDPECSCAACDPGMVLDGWASRMSVCPDCGNKRCPKAADHAKWQCSGSNETGQQGVPVAAGEPGVDSAGRGASGGLGERLRAAADYQDRPGAYDELRAMADEVHRLEVHARVVEQSLRTARGEAKS